MTPEQEALARRGRDGTCNIKCYGLQPMLPPGAMTTSETPAGVVARDRVSGEAALCWTERSQHANRRKAVTELLALLHADHGRKGNRRADEIERLHQEISRLLDSREAEGDRLDWLLTRLPGNVIRDLVGEMSDTGDVAQWRASIDRAAGFKPRATQES